MPVIRTVFLPRMPRLQFTLRASLLLAGSIMAGATTHRIASSIVWRLGKTVASLSPRGNVFFCLLGASAGFVFTLAVLYSKPPAWVKASRLGPCFIAGSALFASCVAGAFAMFAWYIAVRYLPREFYRFVFY